MQAQSLRIKSYRSWAVDINASPVAIERLRKLELYQNLKSEGLSQTLSLKGTSINCQKSAKMRAFISN